MFTTGNAGNLRGLFRVDVPFHLIPRTPEEDFVEEFFSQSTVYIPERANPEIRSHLETLFKNGFKVDISKKHHGSDGSTWPSLGTPLHTAEIHAASQHDYKTLKEYLSSLMKMGNTSEKSSLVAHSSIDAFPFLEAQSSESARTPTRSEITYPYEEISHHVYISLLNISRFVLSDVGGISLDAFQPVCPIPTIVETLSDLLNNEPPGFTLRTTIGLIECYLVSAPGEQITLHEASKTSQTVTVAASPVLVAYPLRSKLSEEIKKEWKTNLSVACDEKNIKLTWVNEHPTLIQTSINLKRVGHHVNE